MDRWLRRFEATLAEEIFAGDKARCVLIAVSGGPDSICLLDLFVRWRRAQPSASRPDLLVGHVNHGLRGLAADDDAKFVKACAAKYGLEALVVTGDAACTARQRRLSSEAAARELRYSTFLEWAEERDLSDIALAHQLDDQAETVLLRAIRGSGVRGIRAMSPVRRLVDDRIEPRLIRPILGWRRQEVEEYLAARDLVARSDATNDDRAVPRNLVRHEVLPRLEKAQPGAIASLAQLGTVARELQWDLEQLARTIVAGASLERSGDVVAIDGHGLDAYPESLLREIVLALFETSRSCEASSEVTVRSVAPRVPRAVVRELRDGLLGDRKRASQWDLGENVRLELRYGKVWLRRRQAIQSKEHARLDESGLEWAEWEFSIAQSNSNQWQACRFIPDLVATFDADVLQTTGDLMVRSWCQGDRFHPLGAPGSKKLKEFFREQRVPPADRGSVPLLLAGKTIVWVVGHRMGHHGRCRSETKCTVTITARPPSARR